jgi:pentatricopeptide repeat protein
MIGGYTLKIAKRALHHVPKVSYFHVRLLSSASTSSPPASMAETAETFELDRMRAFTLDSSSREVLIKAEEVLLWWAYQRTPESVIRSLQLIEQMAASAKPCDEDVLHRNTVNSIVLNWQIVYKQDRSKTFSPQEILQRLDSLGHSHPSLALSGKALSVLIHGAVQAGHPTLAEHLLKRILDDGIFPPSTHTLNTVLQGYSNANQPSKMESLLQQFRDAGLPLDINSYNLLLSCLANNHQPDHAERYLEELCRGSYHVTPTLWTFHAVLHSWAKQGNPERAESILARIYDPYAWGALGVRPDSTTLNLILASWAKSGHVNAGDRALQMLEERKAWAEAGMVDVAPDIVTYGTVVHALCTSGQVEQADALIRNIYQQTMNQGEHHQQGQRRQTTQQVHVTSETSGTSSNIMSLPNVKLLTPMLEGYSKSSIPDRLQKAEDFFVFLEDWTRYVLHKPVDRTVYNAMMDVYGKCARNKQDIERAVGLLQTMKDSLGAQPNFASYSMLSQLLMRHGQLERAEKLLDEAHARFAQGDELCRPDARSMNQLIRCFCRADAPVSAAKFLVQMCVALQEDKNQPRPDVATFGSVIAAYSRSGLENAVHEAEALYAWLVRLHQQGLLKHGPDSLLFRARLLCWSKARDDDASLRAYQILQEMIKRYNPDVIDFNVVLNAFARQCRPRRAEQLLMDMIAHGRVRPNLTSFNTVLLAWSRVDAIESVEMTERLLRRMQNLAREREWGVEPNSVSYNNLLHCLGRNSKLPDAGERAEATLATMIQARKVSYLSFVTVISIWLKADNLERADGVLRQLYEVSRQGQFKAQYKHFLEVSMAWEASGNVERADQVMKMWRSLSLKRR